MNLRQRRAVLFFTGAIVSLLIGVSALGNFVDGVREEVGPKVPALVLVEDVGAFTPLTDGVIKVVDVPERWLPRNVLTSEGQVAGLVANSDLSEGTYLTDDIVGPPPELESGQREIAILIDAETGVAGKVDSGDRVDIVATFTDPGSGAGLSEVIVSGAEVLEVGDLRDDADGEDDDGSIGDRVVPITFALSVREALVLTHAESFAEQVRLALINPGDETQISPDDSSYTRPEAAAVDEGE